MDCLICHDKTGTYKKYPTKAGYPVTKETMFMGKTKFSVPDYNLIAQNVGKTGKDNCGACHFFGGGGNAVKHGDLDKSLSNPSTHVDVHMASKDKGGAGLSCSDCHKQEEHLIKGKLYTLSSENKDRVTCIECHTEKPHDDNNLNFHTNKLACQTCHIPEVAKVYPTKMYWDWSDAGKKNKKGKPLVIKKRYDFKTEDGKVDSNKWYSYHGKKGNFILQKNLKPSYVWFNGTADHVIIGDKFNPADAPIILNKLGGSSTDGKSKVWPVKIMKGKQHYDTVNNTFVVPRLFGKKESGAYWKNYDWDMANKAGMKHVGEPYSGKFDFIETETYWLLNHMIPTKEETLSCEDCHSKNSVLAGVEGLYIPGLSKYKIIDYIGILAILGSLAFILLHIVIRIKVKKTMICETEDNK